ncbi:hypothetical protein BUALT_Bualt02G0239900 [Buddleja alternifolia]|uniref:MutS-like protein n=1 Tax=Buddleja alternifolia TaxID=168488 RepID=A0AAV6Y727_9LAMI|nr:hypothetical protein BUALT_Bualt02G0239900 [Buddleja alternifolia]
MGIEFMAAEKFTFVIDLQQMGMNMMLGLYGMHHGRSTCLLHVLEFWREGNEDFPLVEMVKYQAQPCLIYSIKKSEESFLAALQSIG